MVRPLMMYTMYYHVCKYMHTLYYRVCVYVCVCVCVYIYIYVCVQHEVMLFGSI